MVYEKQNPPLLDFGVWIVNFYMWYFACRLHLSYRLSSKKWSNARGCNAGCVQNPIRAPCSCYKQGHKTTVDGKRTSHLFENNEESDESRKKFNTEDSSVMSPGVFPRVGWWIVASLQAYTELSKDYSAPTSGSSSARTWTNVCISQYGLTFQDTSILTKQILRESDVMQYLHSLVQY